MLFLARQRKKTLVFCSAVEIFNPVCSDVVVLRSTVEIFNPVCSDVVVLRSAMEIFNPSAPPWRSSTLSARMWWSSAPPWRSSTLSARMWWSSAPPWRSSTLPLRRGDLQPYLLGCGGLQPCLLRCGCLLLRRGDFQSLNSKQDAVFQKITRIESSIEITTAAVNSLSDTVNRLLSDVATHGEKIGKAEASIQHMQQENVSLKSRVEELERYSRRWCVKLLGVKEREEENVRTITINHLARVVPRIKDKLEEAVDVVHRVGKQRPGGSPRHIIIRFATRRYRDIIWMEAKNSIYLRENALYVKESLSKADIESRNKLWPLVLAARKEGKKAGFSGPFAVINNKLLPTQHRIHKLTTNF
ncbi:hypothetical protein DPX16_13478 [Anabarilius grahami]|uniref:Uncharacterized protein n=1 Tax=Anabarilius grahami TaxID=495550 RepID=A0A3N0YBF7_ANAGA|nr:hypothetical protein DPX16_13478 [Anabarilius grahami]